MDLVIKASVLEAHSGFGLAVTITWLPIATTGSSSHCFVHCRIIICRLSMISKFDSKVNLFSSVSFFLEGGGLCPPTFKSGGAEAPLPPIYLPLRCTLWFTCTCRFEVFLTSKGCVTHAHTQILQNSCASLQVIPYMYICNGPLWVTLCQ